MDVTPSPITWVKIKTTLPVFPLPPNADRATIYTERLVLRPFTDAEADVVALHALRTQPEVMVWSVQGRPDADLEATRTSLARDLPPCDTNRFNWAICDRATGSVLGIGGTGSFRGELGWPEMGYMLRREAWGKGYGTEFAKALLQAWWALPRCEVELEVDASTVLGDGPVKDEMYTAVTIVDNMPSQHVLRKVGMQLVKVFEKQETNDDGEDTVTLCGFQIAGP